MPKPNFEELEKKAAADNGIERRIMSFKFEVRADGEGKTPKIVGHASVFNQPQDLGWFVESVKPGAFAATIAADDIRALFNHDPNFVLGRNTAGTLRLSEDATGLFMEITPGTRSYELDLMQSIARGDVSQASIGFRVVEQVVREDDDNLYRDLTVVKLYDVSPVTFPAFPTTDVAMRSSGMNYRSLEAVAKEFRRGPGEKQAIDEGYLIELEARLRAVEIEGML